MAESISSLQQIKAKGKQQWETLESRLPLLKRENDAERKRKKQIEYQADRAYVRKKQHDEYLEQERNRHQLEDKQFMIRKHQIFIKNLQREQQIDQVGQALRDAKHQEFKQFEQQRKKYADFIKDQKQQQHEKKKQMRELIKQLKKRSFELNKKYWDDRINGYEQQRHIKRM